MDGMQDPRGVDRFSLAGRVAIVTGAGSGLGRAVAVGLAEVGARIVAASLHDGPTVSVAAGPCARR